MKTPPPPLSAPAAQRIPFAQATPEQLAQAERSVRDKLGGEFLPILKVSWTNALQTLQPDLWVTAETVSLDAHELARVTQHLNALPEVALARTGHGPRKLYFARQPMNCPAEVLRALAELEASPQAGGPAVYQLVTGVVRHHAQVETFYWTKGPDPREDDGTDPDQARAALLARG
ncbi:hypothetical protein CDA63_18900 [Hymenobacter amundsenii]|uniref:Uncharacterized protein n=1 Tax=Hymenobacter amundsenii TaxID=2006685 RepID=A0A246FG94_9BACT|nr:hypothetical protein [Hymenobacter amundsenii]OWP61534.1 hypothetical protein CDA63_18900 [Hymenobacter amundsenii]